MLDLRFVVENKDRVLKMLADRGQSLDQVRSTPGLEGVDPWALDGERREVIQRVESLRHRQRVTGEEIARLGREKKDTSALKAEMKGVADEIKAGEERLPEIEEKLRRVPPRGPESARRERSRGPGRRGQRGDPQGGRATAIRLHAQGPLGRGHGARLARLRARHQGLGRALRLHLRRPGPAGASPRGLHAGPAHARARLPRGGDAVPRQPRHPHRHGPASEVRGRPLQDPARRARPLPDPHRRGPARPTSTRTRSWRRTSSR